MRRDPDRFPSYRADEFDTLRLPTIDHRTLCDELTDRMAEDIRRGATDRQALRHCGWTDAMLDQHLEAARLVAALERHREVGAAPFRRLGAAEGGGA